MPRTEQGSALVTTFYKKAGENVPQNVPENRLRVIFDLIKNNKNITILTIAKQLNVNEKTIKRDVIKLKQKDHLLFVILEFFLGATATRKNIRDPGLIYTIIVLDWLRNELRSEIFRF